MNEAVARARKRVTLLIHGHGCEFFPGGKSRIEVDVAESASIDDVLDVLGVNRNLVMFVVAEGVRRERDYVPAQGEEVLVVTPPSGG